MVKAGAYIVLDDAEISEADTVARLRNENAYDEKRKPGNNLKASSEDLSMHIRGARGERAAKAFFDPIEWHSYQTGNLTNLPDLGDFIDIKTVPPHPTCMLIAKRGSIKLDWAYVLCEAMTERNYRLCGWVWGHELIVIPLTEPKVGWPAHVVREDS